MKWPWQKRKPVRRAHKYLCDVTVMRDTEWAGDTRCTCDSPAVVNLEAAFANFNEADGRMQETLFGRRVAPPIEFPEPRP